MPKEEWGVKRVCPTTGKRFYDLNKNPIVSPYTGEIVNIDNGKRNSFVAEDTTRKLKPKAAEEEDDVILDDDDSSDVELDDDLLDDDDDDNVSLDELADVAADNDDN
ncbi:TIGR02300 family protein [Donghicola sp. XS_ASV15]|uniref:TIGR02300 family protein n=1 Tax=Donghicola sp. XS_ASV15 TaxID=3241295 RepID=UPI0035163177